MFLEDFSSSVLNYRLDILSGYRRLFETSMQCNEGPFTNAVILNESKVLYVMLESTVSVRC